VATRLYLALTADTCDLGNPFSALLVTILCAVEIDRTLVIPEAMTRENPLPEALTATGNSLAARNILSLPTRSLIAIIAFSPSPLLYTIPPRKSSLFLYLPGSSGAMPQENFILKQYFFYF
jgi:hypothetical protein